MMADKEARVVVEPLFESRSGVRAGVPSRGSSTVPPRNSYPSPPNSATDKRPNGDLRPLHTGSTDANPFRRSMAGSTAASTSTNPFRRSVAGSTTASSIEHAQRSPKEQNAYPSPPNSASPRRERFSYRAEAFGPLMNESRPRRSSQPVQPSSPLGAAGITRGNSLRERYPGDSSHRPLELIRKDTKTAHRAHHLRKKNLHGADTIDRLDRSGVSYHHDGPYDAVNLNRNLHWKHSPVAAVRSSNAEALRATPRENVVDAVHRHRPLDGVAMTPPGVPDRLGRVLDYEEGADLHREPGGDYRRWPGVDYLPGDLKGKGEPSYSIEKALKDHKQFGDSGMELRSRRRNVSFDEVDVPRLQPAPEPESSGMVRSNTTGRSAGGLLRKRFGSLRRRSQSIAHS